MRHCRLFSLIFPITLALMLTPGCTTDSGETPDTPVSPTPPPSATTPAAPTNLEIVGTTADLTDLVFKDNSNNETGFHVYVDGSLYKVLGPGISSFQVGPPCGSTYKVKVAAFNGAGESAFTNTVNVQGYCAPVTIPAPPSNLKKTGYTAAFLANMEFKDNSDNETGFRVYDNGNLLMTLGPNENAFQLDPMHGTFNATVTAFNTAGESAATNSVKVPTDCSDCH